MARGPDQAPEDVARLGVPHLHRRRLYGDRLNAGLGSRRRKANARELREGNAAQVTRRVMAATEGMLCRTFKKLSSIVRAVQRLPALCVDGDGGEQ